MTPDVVVIGAGPAGMAAATALARRDVDTLVVDEQGAPGGQIYRAIERVNHRRQQDLQLLGEDYSQGLAQVEAFNGSGARFAPKTSVWDLSSTAHELSLAVVDAQGTRVLRPKQVIIATGAMERPTPFPGWTLPGVMGVGAAQTLLKESGLIGNGQVVLAGTGPLVYLFAYQLLLAGAPPVLLLDNGPRGFAVDDFMALLAALPGNVTSIGKGLAWLRRITTNGMQRVRGIRHLRALGTDHLEAIEYQCGRQNHNVKADLLLVHDGVIPNTHLAMAADCQHNWNNIQHYWAPQLSAQGESSRPAITIVGDAGGIGGAPLASLAGTLCGARIAHRLGRLDGVELKRQEQASHQAMAPLLRLRRFLDAHYRPHPMFSKPVDDGTLVCRCEEVSVRQLREVAAMGCVGPNQGKAFTRCGMGPCMGRECGNTVSRIIADHHHLSIKQVGHYRIRPPVRPITVGQLTELQDGD